MNIAPDFGTLVSLIYHEQIHQRFGTPNAWALHCLYRGVIPFVQGRYHAKATQIPSPRSL